MTKSKKADYTPLDEAAEAALEAAYKAASKAFNAAREADEAVADGWTLDTSGEDYEAACEAARKGTP